MATLFFIDIFLLGLIVGSFLNTIIYRLHTSEDFVFGRSKCPDCGHELAWDDLIPVFSFFVLGGKCRYCRKPISWQYPLIELVTAILFLAVFSQNIDLFFDFLFFAVLKITFLFYVVSSLVVIAAYDFKHYIIPNKVIFPLIGATSLWYLMSSLFFQTYSLTDLLGFVVAGFYSAAFFWVINIATRGKGMGMGDVKLGFFMGLFLGYPSVLMALFLSFFIGSIAGLGLILFGGKKFKSEVPFAPFLVTGTFLAMLFGQWFLGFNLFRF